MTLLQSWSIRQSDLAFMMFGALLAFSSTFGQTYFIGILQPAIREEFGWNEATFGWIYLAVTLGSFFGINLFGRWIDRMALPRYIMLLLAGLVASMLLLIVAKAALLFIAALMLVRMIGQGLIVHAAFTSMGRYFEDLRGRAIAIASIGIPVGQAVFPPLAIGLFQSLEWRTALLWLTGLFAVIMIPLIGSLLIGHSARHAEWQARVDADAARPPEPGKAATVHLKRGDMIRDTRFYLMLPNFLIGPFWVTAVFFFAEQVAAFKGLSLLEFTGYYVYFAIGGAVIPFIGGWLVDLIGGRRMVVLPPLMALAALLVLQQGSGTLAIIGYFLLLGSASGFAVPINNALWAELYGTRYLGEIKAMASGLGVLSTALAPLIVGQLLVANVPMSVIIGGGIAHALLAIPLVVPLSMDRIKPPQPRTTG